MRIQYFTNDWQFIWKERATVSQQSFILNKIATLAITYSELTYSGSLPLVYPYKLFPVPSGLLGCTLSPPSVLLPSCYLLPTFLLPSCYLLATFFLPTILYLPKEYFLHNLLQIQNFQFSNFKFQFRIASIYAFSNLPSRYLLAIPLLSPCYPLPKKEFFAIFLYSNALFCISIPIKYTIFWLAFMNVVIPPN